MIHFTRHDEDRLWSIADGLVKNKQYEDAKALIKLISERAFASIGLSLDVTNTFKAVIPNQKPIDDKLIERMQQLNEQLRDFIEKHQQAKAKLTLIDYVDTLSEALGSDEKEELRKELLASLIDLPPKDGLSRTPVYLKGRKAAASDLQAMKSKWPKTKEQFDAQLIESYSPKEASEILGVSDQTIRRMCEKGKFPEATQTSGGHWKIPKHYFKITLEEARARKQAMKEIDQRTISETRDHIDEFDLL